MSSLFYLNKYLVKYKWRLIFGALFILVSNIFKAYMPVVVKDSINEMEKLINSNDSSNVDLLLGLALGAAGLYILMSLFSGLFLFFTRQTIIVMSRFIEYDLKNEIYDQYQKLSFNFYKENSTGDLMNRISEDVTKVRMYLGPGIMYTVNLFFLFTLIIYQMLSTNPTLTFYVLLPLPVMSVLIYFVSNTLNKRSESVQEQQSFLSTIVHESFSGIRVIKSHNKEKESEERFNKQAEEYKNRSMKLATTNAFFMPTIILLIGISTILTIYIGSIQAVHHEISAGEIAEFVIYVNLLTWPFASVGWVTSIVQRAAASQKRINEFMSAEAEIVSTSHNAFSFTKNIKFEHVGMTYDNSGVKAFHDVSFEMNKGQTLGILGKTGVGKSSIAYLMMRLLDPTTGQILIDGKNLSDLNLDDWRKHLGYVPQEHFLFSDTIRNNILFGVNSEDVSEEKLIQASKDAGIYKTIMSFPKQFETRLGERGINLSGGQKQRISIARALIKNPSILVLDDCLSAVDNETEEQILNSIKGELNEKTAIIISHRISSIKYADRIIVLDEGEVKEEGNHSDLLALNGLYARIFEKQKLQEEE